MANVPVPFVRRATPSVAADLPRGSLAPHLPRRYRSASRSPGRPRLWLIALLALLAGALPLIGATPTAATELPGPIYTGVDGFTPVLYTPSGSTRPQVWQIAHHSWAWAAGPKLACTDLATNQPCTAPGGGATSWPKPLNTAAGPLGAGATGDISTTREPLFVLSGSTLYYPAITQTALSGFPNGSVGVGCVNLATQADCAYVPLQGLTNIPGGTNVNGLTGFVQSGTKLYGVSTTGQVLCFDTATGSACAGQPYTGNVPVNPVSASAGAAPADYFGTMAVVGGKVYITATDPPSVTCFDPTTNAACTGWTPQSVGNSNSIFADALFGDYSSTGAVSGVCVSAGNINTSTNVVINCFNTSGGAIGTPSFLRSIYPTGHAISIAMNPLTTTVGGHLRSYFPFSTSDHAYVGQTLCFDWNTQARCTGFPTPTSHAGVNGGSTFDYGYAYDGTCLLAVGDTGWLFTIDPNTGATPC